MKPLILFFSILGLCCSYTEVIYLEYHLLDSQCGETGTKYILPLMNQQFGTNFSMCGGYLLTYNFSTYQTKFTLSEDRKKIVVEKFNENTDIPGCKNGRFYVKNYDVDTCAPDIYPGSKFLSRFHVLDHLPHYELNVTDQKDFLVRSTYLSAESCAISDDLKADFFKTNYNFSPGVGEIRIVDFSVLRFRLVGFSGEWGFRCNRSVFVISIPSVPYQNTSSRIYLIHEYNDSMCRANEFSRFNPNEMDFLHPTYEKYRCESSSSLFELKAEAEQNSRSDFGIYDLYLGPSCNERKLLFQETRSKKCVNVPDENYSARSLVSGEMVLMFSYLGTECHDEDISFSYVTYYRNCVGYYSNGNSFSMYVHDNPQKSIIFNPGIILAIPEKQSIEDCLSLDDEKKTVKSSLPSENHKTWDFNTIFSIKNDTCLSYQLSGLIQPGTSLRGKCNSDKSLEVKLFESSGDCNAYSPSFQTFDGYFHCSKSWGRKKGVYDSYLFFCAQNFCFGKSEIVDDVCSGHGKCVSHNHCKCNSIIWFGKHCQVSTFSLIIPILMVSLCCSVICVSFFCICSICICVFCRCCSQARTKKVHQRDGEEDPLLSSGAGFLSNNNYNDESIKHVKTEFVGDPNGEGKIYLIDNHKKYLIFSGNFVSELKEGKGREFFFDPTAADNNQDNRSFLKFEGVFKEGKRHGQGVEFSRMREKILRGVWKNGDIVTIERDFVDIPKFEIGDVSFDFVKDIIGSGSDGDVFSIKYEGQWAALKILKTSIFWKEQHRFQSMRLASLRRHRQLQMFLRSQKIWSKVSQHPYILNLLAWTGVHSDDERAPVAYITELCKMSLEQAIANDVISDQNTRHRLIREVAIGMDYLHSMSIMHRDLKLGNVLLDVHQSVKICDFEFSRYDEKDWKKDGAGDISVLGTPGYVDPEILKGKIYDKSCDVYSYGILVYCIFSGKVDPYHGIEKCGRCGTRIKSSSPLVVQHVVSCGLKPDFCISFQKDDWVVEEIIKPCLNSNPKKRPDFKRILEIMRMNEEKGRIFRIFNVHQTEEIVLRDGSSINN